MAHSDEYGSPSKPVGLIHDPSVRKKRAFRNRVLILDFLRSEIYSSTEILKDVVGLKERGTRRLLQRMVEERLLLIDEVKFLRAPALRLWGISPAGLYSHLSNEVNYQKMSLKHHSPGRVAPITIEHTLLTQRVKLLCCMYDMENWVPTRLMPGHEHSKQHRDRWPVYPDGIQLNQHDVELSLRLTGEEFETFSTAHEVERTRKTPRRYISVMNGHLTNIAQGRYHRVVYWCVNHQSAASLRQLFQRIAAEEKFVFESTVSDNQCADPLIGEFSDFFQFRGLSSDYK